MSESRNILIVGKGAAAIALAKKLHNDVIKIYIAPGNGILSGFYENIDIREDDLTELLKFALENNIELTIPISETALTADIVSFFQLNGQKIFGPLKEACNIATNKAGGKKFLYKIHAQTSKFGVFDKLQQAQSWLDSANFPINVRTCEYNYINDRLTCPTIKSASDFAENLFNKGENCVLFEEFVFGHNFTVYYITDGYSAIPIATVGDYKFEQDGDGGLLTNGVGCYTPDYKVSETIITRISNIVNNTLSSIERKGVPYVGILGVDCTITVEDKFFVNEFKPFLQDFDAHAVLNTIDDNLLKIFHACVDGIFSDEYERINLNNTASVSAVVRARNTAQKILGLNMVEDINNIDFQSIRHTNDGNYITQGQDAFVITECSSTLSRAKTNLYENLSVINFAGMRYRKDILG